MTSRRISSTRALCCALLLFTVLLLLASWNAHGFCTRTYTAASSSSSNRRASSKPLLRLQESDQNNKNDSDATTTTTTTNTNTNDKLGFDTTTNNNNNKKEKDSDNNDESYTWAELQADEKLRQTEFNSSIKRKNTMLLPQRISQAITTLGWTFVITGVVLNSMGLAFVPRNGGGIGVGTLEERDFQREMLRRDDNDGGKTKDDASIIISRAYGNDNAGDEYIIKKWVVSSNEDEQQTC